MAFHVKKHEVNHTPQWYREHCRAEDAPPSIRAMLLTDMKLIGADIDSTLHDEEQIENYEEAWNEVLHDDPSRGSLPNGMLEAIELEMGKGFRPSDYYQRPPFTWLERFLDKHDLDVPTVREYLKWLVRQRSYEDSRAKKEAEREAEKKRPHKWFTSEADPRQNDVDVDRL